MYFRLQTFANLIIFALVLGTKIPKESERLSKDPPYCLRFNSVSKEVLTSIDRGIGIVMDKIQNDEGKIKWISFVPQIGGSAIGCKKATGVAPITTLSYSTFTSTTA